MEIQIRPYEPTDAEALHAAALESIPEVFPWLPWCHPGYLLEEAIQWASGCGKLFAEGAEYNFVITGNGGRFLGACGLNQIHRANRLANLGYWVRTSAMGQGVALAGVRLLSRFAFTKTDLIRLEILCAKENVRSQRVAEKAGALREGVLRDRIVLHEEPHDAVLFSLVRSEWKGI